MRTLRKALDTLIAVLAFTIIPGLVAGILLAQSATQVQQSAARIDGPAQFATSASTGATMTLTPNAGETVYIYSIDIDACGNATGGTAGAVTTLTATTNISGTPAWTIGTGSTTAGALGGPGLCQIPLKIAYPTGLRAQTPGTAVVFTMPTFAANQTTRVNIGWRSAPSQ